MVDNKQKTIGSPVETLGVTRQLAPELGVNCTMFMGSLIARLREQ